MELGIDAGVTFGLDEPRVTTISIPAQHFRIGFVMGDRVSIEPAFALNSIRAGGETVTAWNAEMGVLWHTAAVRSGPYLRPFVGVMGFSHEGHSDTRASVGAGLGYKIPVIDQRVAWRLEANYAYAFKTDHDPAASQIGLRAGLSFFTR
jgi:outer membrane protein assembly factor BamA